VLLREEEHFAFYPDDTTDYGIYQILNTPVYLILGRASIPEVTECLYYEYLSSKSYGSGQDLEYY
jgi:hypothetical protein